MDQEPENNYSRDYLRMRNRLFYFKPDDAPAGLSRMWELYSINFKAWQKRGVEFVVNQPAEVLGLWLAYADVKSLAFMFSLGKAMSDVNKMSDLDLINMIKDIYEKSYVAFSFFCIAINYDHAFISKLPDCWGDPQKAKDAQFNIDNGSDVGGKNWVLMSLPFREVLKALEIDEKLISQIRRCFSHGDYNITNEGVQLLWGDITLIQRSKLMNLLQYLLEATKIAFYFTFKILFESGCWVILLMHVLMPKRDGERKIQFDMIEKLQNTSKDIAEIGRGDSDKNIQIFTIGAYEIFCFLRVGLYAEVYRHRMMANAYCLDRGYTIDWAKVEQMMIALTFHTTASSEMIENAIKCFVDCFNETGRVVPIFDAADNLDDSSDKDIIYARKIREMVKNVFRDNATDNNVVNISSVLASEAIIIAVKLMHWYSNNGENIFMRTSHSVSR